ncbi:MAG TPA: outer membrane beta-barrel protein [Gemmatimonadales bacterium]|jgi:hypothetical protein|nr:outer membrane beta-barrel protein [Gemmatimonadales bacterium]
MMKGIVKGLVAAGLGLVLVAVPAQAQIGWQVGAGLTMPQGDFGDGFKSGFHAMGAANFALTGAPIGIRADAAYNMNKVDASGVDISSNILTVSGDAKYSFAPGPVSPYLLGGITWARASISGSDAPSGVDAQSDIGFNFGGGINFGLGSLKAFAEARYFTIGGDVDADFIPITVGLRF